MVVHLPVLRIQSDAVEKHPVAGTDVDVARIGGENGGDAAVQHGGDDLAVGDAVEQRAETLVAFVVGIRSPDHGEAAGGIRGGGLHIEVREKLPIGIVAGE